MYGGSYFRFTKDRYFVQVYSDFMMYKEGVYHHTNLLTNSGFEPFEVRQTDI